MSLPYKAFLSYARDPDALLARDVERFIEDLHKNNLIVPEHRKRLQICRDGSDFRLPPVPKGDAGETLFTLVRAHLSLAEYLIVLVGPRSRNHRWLNRELNWWLDNRGPDKVLVCVTHGKNPRDDKQSVFPDAILKYRLDQRLWFDFRRFHTSSDRGLVSPSDYEDERIRLAAELLDTNAGALTDYYRVKRRRNQTINWIRNTALGMLGLALSVGGYLTLNEFTRLEVIRKSNELADAATLALAANQPVSATQHGLSAVETSLNGNGVVTKKAEDTLRAVLSVTGGFGVLGQSMPVEAVSLLTGALISVSPTGQSMIHPFSDNLEFREPVALDTPDAPLLDVIESENGNDAALIYEDGTVLMVNSTNGHPTTTVRSLKDFDTEGLCAIHTDSSGITALTTKGILRNWDFQSSEYAITPSSYGQTNSGLSDCKASPSGSFFLHQEDSKPRLLSVNRATGRSKLHQFPGKKRTTRVAAFSPNENLLALSFDEGWVEVWDLPQEHEDPPTLIATIIPKNTSEEIVALALSNDNNQLGIASREGTVSIWSIQPDPRELNFVTLNLRLDATPSENYGTSLTYLRHGQNLLVADGARGYVLLEFGADFSSVNVRDISLHGRPDGQEWYLGQSLAQSPNSEILMFAGNNNDIQLFAWTGAVYQRRLVPLKGHDRPVSAMAFSKNGRLFASADHNGHARIWRMDPATLTAQPAVLPEEINDRLLNGSWVNPYSRIRMDWLGGGDSTWLYSEGDDHTGRYSRIDGAGMPVLVVGAADVGTTENLTSSDRHILNLYSADQTYLRQFAKDLIRQAEAIDFGSIESSKVVATAQRLLVQDSEQRLAIWDLETHDSAPIVSPPLGIVAEQYAFNASTGYVAATSANCQVAVWQSNNESTQPILLNVREMLSQAGPAADNVEQEDPQTCDAANEDFDDLYTAFALDGRALLFNHMHLVRNLFDGNLKVHRFDRQVKNILGCCLIELSDTGSQAWELGRYKKNIVSFSLPQNVERFSPVVFDASRERLIIGLDDGNVWIRSKKRDTPDTWSFRAHETRVQALAIDSSTGSVASSGGILSEEIRLTHLADRDVRRSLVLGSHIDRLTGSKAVVNELRFSPSGTFLATGGWDQSVSIYLLRPEDIAEQAKRTAGQQFGNNK